MPAVTVTRNLSSPPAAAWTAIADVTKVANWHPKVDRVDLLSESATGLGAARRCNFYDGTSVVERVTDVADGRRVKLELSEFSMPLAHATVEVEITPTASGGTQATFVLDYAMKFGVFGKLMDAVMVRGQMSKMLGSVLAGLDHHLATGDVVGEDFVAAA